MAFQLKSVSVDKSVLAAVTFSQLMDRIMDGAGELCVACFVLILLCASCCCLLDLL